MTVSPTARAGRAVLDEEVLGKVVGRGEGEHRRGRVRAEGPGDPVVDPDLKKKTRGLL